MQDIGKRLLEWYRDQGRDLPWRESTDPYRIWIAEVILQQTRIAQGIDYFYRFIERFPEVEALAQAEQDEVLKYWEGLGYYSRARNLHAAARQLVEVYDGKFPSEPKELMKLKGIGPYTSRAIASFAFGQSCGVLDGNVMRVMSRLLGDDSPINEAKTRKRWQVLIDEWIAGHDPRDFNHGMMDLGATLCTPQKPACLLCPLQESCQAFQNGMTQLLPVKKKLKRKTRFFNFYLLFNEKEEIAIQQRPVKGFWGGLWEIPNQEVNREAWLAGDKKPGVSFLHERKHVFTHFDMMIKVYESREGKHLNTNNLRFIPLEKISIFAFSKAVLNIFDQMGMRGGEDERM
jgi:A/G-specific adenine glycosylase